MNKWSEEEVKILQEQFHIGGYDAVLTALPHRTYSAARWRISHLDLAKRGFWNNEEKQIVIDNYNGNNINELCVLLPQYTKKAIIHQIEKLSLTKTRPIRYYNREFFRQINTKEKAYILGYFVSDGWINNRGTEFGIVSKDTEHLQLIAQLMDHDGQLNLSSTGFYELKIYSKELVSDLQKLGYDHQKSYTAIYPEIPKELDFHFIRGLFDGDGCITRTKINGYLDVYFLGTKQLLDRVAKILPHNKTPRLKSNQLYKLKYTGTKSIDVLQPLYKDSENLRLERKYNRYLEALSHTGFYAPMPA